MAPSVCTAVGAELWELACSKFSVCEPPGFIAAESSRARALVEMNRSISGGPESLGGMLEEMGPNEPCERRSR